MILLASIGSILTHTLLLLLALIAPFVIFALIIHWFEKVIFVRLAERFGWKVVLWTGWLGTPIHELSHALMCKVFNHRIDEMALFEPDLQTGRLGYVKHSFRRGNWFEELGNFFIGIAPLAGGSLALAALLWVFFPDAVSAAVTAPGEGTTEGALANVAETTFAILAEILTLQNIASLRFWVFIYLVLCVGGHMAPSRSDYQGAIRAGLMVGAVLLIIALTLALLQFDLGSSIEQFANLLAPLFALFLLTIALCGLATGLVVLLTIPIPKTHRVR